MEGSVTWEKVCLLPHEIIEAQLEELQLKVKNPQTPRIQIDVVEARELATNQLIFHGTPNVYVSVSIVPSVPSSKRNTFKPLETKCCLDTNSPQWNETIEFEIQKKNAVSKMDLKIVVRNKATVLADEFLGQVQVPLSTFKDQLLKEEWFELKSTAAFEAPQNGFGKLKLRIQLIHDPIQYLQHQIEQLQQQHTRMLEQQRVFEETKRVLKSDQIHPASFGFETPKTGLYIPGNRFTIESHHPAAVSRTPLADRSRVVTPFGNGTVVSFQNSRKLYAVRLDGESKLAYVQENHVVEEAEPSDFDVGKMVDTTYGSGKVLEVRSDGSIAVQLDFGVAYVQKEQISPSMKTLDAMSPREKIARAIQLTDAGNEAFKGSQHVVAVQNYLQALGYLQCVPQDTATYKEKALILQTMIRCHLNLGASKLKTENYTESITASTNAIQILDVLYENRQGQVVEWLGRLGVSQEQLFEDWRSKALYRRGQAFVKKMDFAAAKADLTRALEYSPKLKFARALLDRVSKLLAREKKKEQQTWAGIFDNKTTQEEASKSVPVVAATKPEPEPLKPAPKVEVLEHDVSSPVPMWATVAAVGALAATVAIVFSRKQ